MRLPEGRATNTPMHELADDQRKSFHCPVGKF
jgi:hypothetical protein